MGGEAKQYQVVLDPRKMAGFKLSLSEVLTALRAEQRHVGGGYIEKNRRADRHPRRGAVQGRRGHRDTVRDVRRATARPSLLKQLGEVRIGPALRYGVVTMHGKGEIVAGTVMMLIGANSREVVTRVKAQLAEIQKELPAGVEIRSVLRPRRVHRAAC